MYALLYIFPSSRPTRPPRPPRPDWLSVLTVPLSDLSWESPKYVPDIAALPLFYRWMVALLSGRGRLIRNVKGLPSGVLSAALFAFKLDDEKYIDIHST